MRTAAMVVMCVSLGGCRTVPSAGTTSPSGLEAEAAFAGTVADRSTGKGVEGATIALKPNDPARTGLTSVAVRTRGDGAFVIEHIVPGRYTLDVTARGYGATQASVYFSPAQSRKGYRYQVTPVRACPPPVAGKKSPGCP